MSWAAHDFEPYILQRHFGKYVSLLPLYLGSVGPDLLTKWYVYGVDLFGIRLAAADPVTFHRGWPGAGFTHAPLFGVLLGLVVLLATRNRVWALSLCLGIAAHGLTDTLDTNGTMLLFPFSTERHSLGAWAYAAEEGRFLDALAYYSSLGLVCDVAWGVLVLAHWQVLKQSYFETTVLPHDPVWKRLGAFLPMTPMLALYRLGFIYGSSRVFAWLLWAHVLHSNPFDLSWGGPYWVTPVV